MPFFKLGRKGMISPWTDERDNAIGRRMRRAEELPERILPPLANETVS
jgi:hypothetical protein